MSRPSGVVRVRAPESTGRLLNTTARDNDVNACASGTRSLVVGTKRRDGPSFYRRIPLTSCLMVESLFAGPISSIFPVKAFDRWRVAFNSALLVKRRRLTPLTPLRMRLRDQSTRRISRCRGPSRRIWHQPWLRCSFPIIRPPLFFPAVAVRFPLNHRAEKQARVGRATVRTILDRKEGDEVQL